MRLMKRFSKILLTSTLALVALASWAFSSPLGASPDDDFHLASIWCGLGDRSSICEPAASLDERLVPNSLSLAHACYARQPDQSAQCQTEYFNEADQKLVATDRGNFTNLYPPLYYATMSMFASSQISFSALTMRLFNVFIFVGIAVLLFRFLPKARRETLVWSLAFATVPLGAFLLSSNNPSAWAIISAGTLWLALVGYFESSGFPRIMLAVVAVLSSLLGAGSRADSALYGILAVFVAILLTAKRNRAYWVAALLPTLIIVVSVLLYSTAHQANDAATTGLTGTSADSLSSKVALAVSALLNIPLLWAGVFGSWGLGWFDTALPGVVSVGVLSCFVACVFVGLAHLTARKIIAFCLVLAALVIFPVYVFVQSNVSVGSYVQPRYVLPLIVLLGGVALFQVKDKPFRLNRFQYYLVVAVLFCANAISLHINLRRYITGRDVNSVNLDAGIEWWWNIPFSPMTVWIVGSVSFALCLYLVTRNAIVFPRLSKAEGKVLQP